MPDAWAVKRPGTVMALFLDYGRAMAYAIRVQGQLVALYEGAVPEMPEPRPEDPGRNPSGGV